MCHWTTGLNSDKTSKVFCINICCFSTRFYFLYHNGTVIQNCGCFWFLHPIKLEHCAVSSNDQYQGNGFAAEVLLWRNQPRVVPVGPIVRGVIAFPILGTWWYPTTQVASQLVHWQASMAFRIFSNNNRLPFWILKILIFDHVTVIVVQICCCIPNFIKIGLHGWPSDTHNCWMSSAPLQGNGRCHGNRIMSDMSGTWWDATSEVSSQLVHC